MKKVTFCRVKLDYVKYLHSFEEKVQYDEKKPNRHIRKPYLGIVLKINNFNYFVPLESPKGDEKSKQHLMKIYDKDKTIGILCFNNMIPIKESELVHFDFNNEEPHYKSLLIKQFFYCKSNWETIESRALKTYKNVTIKKVPFICDLSCDFKLLEEKSKLYSKPI